MTRIDVQEDLLAFHRNVVARSQAGDRFAGMYAADTDAGPELTVLFATDGGFDAMRTRVRGDGDGTPTYPSLTPSILGAFWYERAIHDLSGLVADGHPRLDPLLLHASAEEARARAHVGRPGLVLPDKRTPPGPVDVHGRGMFTLPLGPVRSGVFESVEFLIESLGEDIPHLNIRPHYKHRGIAAAFHGASVSDGALTAERVEGIASVSHALGFSHAVERIAGITPPRAARLVRVVFAELERIANHLEVMERLAEAAGLSVAISRFAWHKESIMRLVSELCGSRFGRGVVVPGGVRPLPHLDVDAAMAAVAQLAPRVRAEADLAMKTPSFLDRLRGTGILTPEKAKAWGALGPVGRASGAGEDARWARPTDAYAELPLGRIPGFSTGDVLARTHVRWAEIQVSFDLIRAGLAALAADTGTRGADEDAADALWATPVPDALTGFALGWAEAPQGEVLYALSLDDGRIARCFARSASFHNLATYHEVFNGDVYTDFAFIEASYGTGYAGAAM